MKKRKYLLLVAIATLCTAIPDSSLRAQAQKDTFASSTLLLQEAPLLRAGSLKRLKTSQYVAKDIYGTTYDIDAILQSGKAILMDFSATACHPCWLLHQRGVLESMYEKFGPEGTNQLEIFWIEALGAPIKEIQKRDRDWTKDKDGNPVPYPVFSDNKMLATLFGLNPNGSETGGWPTFILVGPGNEWITCREEVRNADNEFTDFAKLLTLFVKAEDKPSAVRIAGPRDLYPNETHLMRVFYKSATSISSIKWEAPQGVTLTKVSDTTYKLTTSDKLGIYQVRAYVSNKNGTTETTATITVSPPITTYPFIATMDTKDKMDKGWRSIDHDGDGYGFDSFMGQGLMERLGISFSNPDIKPGAEDSDDNLISWGTLYPTKKEVNKPYEGEKITPNNELRSAPLVIPSDATNPVFSCYIANWLKDNNPDQLKVMVSELNAEAVELLPPQNTTQSWKQLKVDLSAYKGKTIILSLIPIVNGTSGILVDQLRVTLDGSTSVDAQPQIPNISISPNPATDAIRVEAIGKSTVELFAMDGTCMARISPNEDEATIDVSHWPRGYYVVRISSPQAIMVQRVIIN